MNLIGMFGHKGGIGNAARANRDILEGLVGNTLTLDFPSALHKTAAGLPAWAGDTYLHFNPASCKIEDLLATDWFETGRKICFWEWETTETPPAWLDYDQHMNQIWVATTFVRDSLRNSGFKTPVHVIPHAVELKPQHVFPRPDEPIRFLVQFDVHSRLSRKRPDLAISAITRAALKSGDMVEITIKANNLKDHPIDVAEYSNIKINLIDAWLDDVQMDNLWNNTDVFVSMNRGEGFGFPQVEAMARGIAVVSTMWGGSTDYLTCENSYPVNVKCLEPVTRAQDKYFKTGEWALPDKDHAITQIIRCMEDIRSGTISAVSQNAVAEAGKFSTDQMEKNIKSALALL